MTGLYLHIPFCHARCGYCDFTTFTGKEDQIERYVETLQKEIQLLAVAPADCKPGPSGVSKDAGSRLTACRDDDYSRIDTIFFGGGTPSLLEPRQVEKILSAVRRHFDLDPQAEITMEANPESVTVEKAAGWRAAGVNRISLGLQAMDDALLQAMDRLHSAAEFKAAYACVRNAGFTNVSVDLIYGFPGQTFASWQDTLRQVVILLPEHLSLYALKVEEHTPFRARGVQVDDDAQAEMYGWAREFLGQSGYPQYEISNFSRPGRECRHNLIYWRQEDYFGIGVGAVGCVRGVRWENHKNLPDYYRDVSAGRLPYASTETLSPETQRFERLMLGLRLREGLAWNETNPEWLRERERLASSKLLEEITPGRWRIPEHAIAVTNQILLPFA